MLGRIHMHPIGLGLFLSIGCFVLQYTLLFLFHLKFTINLANKCYQLNTNSNALHIHLNTTNSDWVYRIIIITKVNLTKDSI